MKKLTMLLIIALIIAASCKEDEVNLFPTAPVLSLPSMFQTQVELNEKLYWQAVSDPDGDAVVYNVFFGEDSLQLPLVAESLELSSFSPELESHKKYYWKIASDDGKKGISESSVWSFTTLNAAPDTVILEFPINEALSIDYNLELRWQQSTDLDGDEISYSLFLDTLETLTSPIDMLDNVSYKTELQANTTYFWRVEARDNYGAVSASEVSRFTTKMGPPSSFYLLSPQDTTTLSYLLTIPLVWSKSTSFDSNKSSITYDLYVDTDVDANNRVAEGLNDTTYTIPGLLGNTRYYWKVIAKDIESNQTESETWSFTTNQKAVSEDSFVDNRDGQRYDIVQIGEQVWMAENINYTTRDGSYCYNDESMYCTQYGKMYTWDAAKEACPDGWKVPSTSEWEELIAYASQNGYEGREAVAHKSTTGWTIKEGATTDATVNGTDEFGFNALPSGRKSSDTCLDIGLNANYWTDTQIYTKGYDFMQYIILRWYYDDFHIAAKGYTETNFCSVRCIKE